MVWKEALVFIGTPIIRSVSGWAVNALEDKKITLFEWRMLGSTIVRVGTYTAIGYYGIVVPFGLDVGMIGAAAGAFVVDLIIQKLDKLRKK